MELFKANSPLQKMISVEKCIEMQEEQEKYEKDLEELTAYMNNK